MRAITVEPTGTTDDKGRPTPPGPEQIRVSEVDAPSPAAGELLVTTVAAGVNRADLLQRQGFYPPPKGITEVMGLEATGHVAEVGEGVEGWQVGDEVVALLSGGGYAEQFVVPAQQCVRPPEGVDLVTAATLIEVAATVVSNMDAVSLRPGELLLAHGGAGGIGTFAIQYAKALGCRVATTAGTEAKLNHCRDLGADIALDYHDDWVAGLKQANDGRGADVILDIMGGSYLEQNVDALAPHGRIATIGLQGGRKGTLDLAKLLNKWGTVTASSLRFRDADAKGEIARRVAQSVWPMFSDGRLKPAPIERFDFTDAAAAHARLGSGEVTGKLVLVF